MTVYEANREMYRKVPDMNLKKVVDIVEKYLRSHQAKYYMMLSNEEKYYTIYTFKGEYLFNTMANEIVDIAKSLGPIKDVLCNEFGALEMWIDYQNNPTLFMLFDYTRGVVEI